MVRGIEFYIIMWIFVSFGVILFRNLSGKEKWNLIKSLAFVGLTAFISVVIVILIVVLF